MPGIGIRKAGRSKSRIPMTAKNKTQTESAGLSVKRTKKYSARTRNGKPEKRGKIARMEKIRRPISVKSLSGSKDDDSLAWQLGESRAQSREVPVQSSEFEEMHRSLCPAP